MPPDKGIPAGSPADWLRHAKADLMLAQVPLPQDGLYSSLCFHAQQAAEKSLKAVLVHSGIEFPRTHSIVRLIDLLPADVERTNDMIASGALTAYATAARYPAENDSLDVSARDRDRAAELAKAVVAWAEDMIQS